MRKISDFINLPSMEKDPFEKQIEKIVNIKTVKKGTILKNANEIGKQTYFVKKGILRSFIIDEKGKEHIFMFAPENWLIGDFDSDLQLKATPLVIDVIENAEIYEIDSNKFQSAVFANPQMYEEGLLKLRKRVAVLQKRIMLLMSASALTRYEDFVQTYPNIVQRVPQKMIASYLGITPEALSKIRGDLAKGK